MYDADALIERVVASSQVPSASRRREIARELRGHIEDFVSIAREAGHSEQEIERLVVANFGDPKQIAQEFAWVYRRERVVLRLWVFLLFTLAAGALVSTAALAVQASVAIGLGVPVIQVFGEKHLSMELLTILSVMAAYAALLSLESIFDAHRFRNAAATLATFVCATAGALTLLNVRVPVEILLFALASGLLLRATQLLWRSRMTQAGAVLAYFATIGFVLGCLQPPNVRSDALIRIAVWFAIGISCHLITYLAARMNRALLNADARS